MVKIGKALAQFCTSCQNGIRNIPKTPIMNIFPEFTKLEGQGKISEKKFSQFNFTEELLLSSIVPIKYSSQNNSMQWLLGLAIFCVLIKSSQERKEKNEAILEVKKDGMRLGNLSDKFQKDRDVVLAAVAQNGCALMYAHQSLKNDKVIVTEAVKQDGEALEFASTELRKDHKIAVLAVERSGRAALCHVAPSLQTSQMVLDAYQDWLDSKFLD